jgi:hypothetical protein
MTISPYQDSVVLKFDFLNRRAEKLLRKIRQRIDEASHNQIILLDTMALTEALINDGNTVLNHKYVPNHQDHSAFYRPPPTALSK